MSVVAAAVVGSAVVGAGVSLAGQKSAADQASKDRALAQQAQDAQLGIAQQQQDVANEYNDYNKTVFRPLETQLVNEARTAGTEAEASRLGGEAAATVKSAFAQRAEASGRALARQGINPGSARALAVRVNDDANAALASAAAANTARDTARTVAYGKKMDAASLGRNLSSAQAVAANGAIAGANGAAGTSLGVMNAGINQSRVTAANNADLMAGIGGAAGMALRYGSTPGAVTPLQTLNNQFTTTNAPWSASAAFDNPSGY